MFFALFSGLQSQQLQRRPQFGAAIQNLNDSLRKQLKNPQSGGCIVTKIISGATAESLQLRVGDILTSFDGQPIADASNFLSLLQQKKVGEMIKISLQRDGKLLNVVGPLKPYAKDEYPNADVLYDEVAIGKGLVRSIFISPKGKGPFPTLFFIQGYNCASIDNMGPNHPYEKLIQGLLDQGFAIYKTEKPGMGDSDGASVCDQVDFKTELAAFEASYDKMLFYPQVDKEAIFIFGHSMGGIIAPLMKKKIQPLGIAVYGTVTRSWFEYFVEQFRIQNFIAGEDYKTNDSMFHQRLMLCYEFMIQKKSPEVLMQNPEFKTLLTTEWTYQAPDKIFDRHYQFWQQLQDYSLMEAWANCQSNVLSLWGECDFVAFSQYDHELIAEIVNNYHPGKAEFKKVTNSDHAFTYTNSLKHSAENWGNGKYRSEHFNPAIIKVLSDWMKQKMNTK